MTTKPASKPSVEKSLEPMPALPEWGNALRRIAAQPLRFCEDFPRIARRLEAWWAHELLDRPELIEQPDAWFETKLADLRQTHRVGDALPQVRVDFGPVLLGGQLEFGADTAWRNPSVMAGQEESKNSW